MKRRNREINIFSMSALDLFASGMGAFILLAFVALPFFPNTVTEEEVQDLQSELRRAKGERDEARKEREQARAEREQAKRKAEESAKRVSELEVPDLDLVICLDITGSMVDQIESLKSQVASLAEILNKISPTGIGIVAYGDKDAWKPHPGFYLRTVSTDVAAVQAFVAGLSAGMGQQRDSYDLAESISLALEQAESVNMNWRPQAEVRQVVVITDASAKDESAALVVAERLRASNVQVSAVWIKGRYPEGWEEAEDFLRELSERGGGEFVDGNRRSMLGAILLAVL